MYMILRVMLPCHTEIKDDDDDEEEEEEDAGRYTGCCF